MNAHPVRLLSASEIGALFGVSRYAVQKWRERYGPDSAHPFPAPDVIVGDVPGWRPERKAEIRQWRKDMPGQGSGGGRPRRQPE